jgi:hypothetical protein
MGNNLRSVGTGRPGGERKNKRWSTPGQLYTGLEALVCRSGSSSPYRRSCEDRSADTYLAVLNCTHYSIANKASTHGDVLLEDRLLERENTRLSLVVPTVT